MGKRPKCWKTLSSFEISTSKTLLGLDKNKTHTFKLMEDKTSEYIDYFGSTPDKLEEETTLLIVGKPAPARIRWSRGNRSNPHRINFGSPNNTKDPDAGSSGLTRFRALKKASPTQSPLEMASKKYSLNV